MQHCFVVVWCYANSQLPESEIRKQVSIPKCRARTTQRGVSHKYFG